jgi:hypothetical protein
VDRNQASEIARDEWARVSGEPAWTVSEASPYGDDLWMVVLANEKRERFATLVLDEGGAADVVCVEEYQPCRQAG